MGVEIVQNMLPESLMEEAMLPQLKKVQKLNFVRHKATMLFREICESQVDSAQGIYDDKENLLQYYNTLLKVSTIINKIMQSSNRVSFFVANMTPGQYAEVTKMMAWDKLDSVINLIDSILDLLKEENLGYSYDTTELEVAAEQIKELMSTTENHFVALAPEEAKKKEIIESDGASHAELTTQ